MIKQVHKRLACAFGALLLAVTIIPVTASSVAAKGIRANPLSKIEGKIDDIEIKLDRLEVSVIVDEDVCGSIPVQCGGATGHSTTPASSSNHNPVLLVVTVTQHGSPVSGLVSTDFTFKTHTVPAGGTLPVVCPLGASGCASSADFKEIASTGVYALFVHPFPPTTSTTFKWKAGTHVATIDVTDALGNTGRVLLKIEIP